MRRAGVGMCCIALLLAALSLLLPLAAVRPAAGQAAYRCPVTITNNVAANLTDYAVKVVLDSSWGGWQYNPAPDTVYFTDADGNPLYYFIEEWDADAQEARIWVKVPLIPASGSTTIYMYFGGSNPYAGYNDPKRVFLVYDDFAELDTDYWGVLEWTDDPNHRIECGGGELHIFASSASDHAKSGYILYARNMVYDWSYDVKVTVKARFASFDYSRGWGPAVGFQLYSQTDGDGIASIFLVCIGAAGDHYVTAIRHTYDGSSSSNYYIDVPDVAAGDVVLDVVIKADGTVTWSVSGAFSVSDTFTQSYKASGYFAIATWMMYWTNPLSVDAYYDYIIVRKFVDPEPSVTVGPVKPVAGVLLPEESLVIVHDIVYSPNSTQFAHAFTASNASRAGYVLGPNDTWGLDAWGWLVWAESYDAGGTTYSNTAVLVSEVNITLPYDGTYVANLTLLAKYSGSASSSHSLRIEVLDSGGAVLAETTATLSTDWAPIVLSIDATLSGRITVRINATVVSGAPGGGYLYVRDVRVYVAYSCNPRVAVDLTPNADYFNSTVSFAVSLGSTDLVNASTITLKLAGPLLLFGVDYTAQPAYVGDETAGGLLYHVYEVPAASEQTMTIIVGLENILPAITLRVKGYATDTALVGEPVSVELPTTGNITIPELNLTFINTQSAVVEFGAEGCYTIVANVTDPSHWRLGYATAEITVKYGEFRVVLNDAEGRLVDYEYVAVRLVNKTGGAKVAEMSTRMYADFSGLPAGNYSIEVYFGDILVGAADFELSSLTDGSSVTVPLTMMRLGADYRGVRRAVVWPRGAALVAAEDLSPRFPYSRMRILLNGTGGFTLCVDYYGSLPTRVAVSANATGLSYRWDGSCLVISGVLGSVAEINITDNYALRLEFYDRLGNPMPCSYAVINGSKFTGSVIEVYYAPGDYVVELPRTVNGFAFFAFDDGYNKTVRTVRIDAGDVILKAYYRIPTHVEKLEACRVSSLWAFIKHRLLGSGAETALVNIEGYLKDYYGAAVPNRIVTIRVINTNSGAGYAYNVTTDASGYFALPGVELRPGKYRVVAEFAGDDVYVGTRGESEIEVPAAAPAPAPAPTRTWIMLAAAGALVVIGIAVAAKAVRRAVGHTIIGRGRFWRRC